MARSRLGEEQIRDEVVLTEAEHLVVDHSTCSGVPVTLLTLSDTPDAYEAGKYVYTTASGVVWQSMTFGSLPSGGTAGQLLEKQSGVD
jgi:hypothetical protein